MESVDSSRDQKSARRRNRSLNDRRDDQLPNMDDELKNGTEAEPVYRDALERRREDDDRRERDRRDEGTGRSRERNRGDSHRRRRDRDSRSRERSPRQRRDDDRRSGSRERSSRHRRDEDRYRYRSSDRSRSYRDSWDRRDREKTTDKDGARDRGDNKSYRSERSSRKASPPTRSIRSTNPLSGEEALRPGTGDRARDRDEARSRRSERSSRQPSPPPSRSVRSSNPLPDQNALRPGASAGGTPAVDDEPKEKPNFNASGLLAAESNTFQGVVLKYHEPPSAAKPTKKWRLYVFKPPASAPLEILPLHAQSAFLIGRDATICDIPLLHPSISKQHAVIQFKWRERVNEYGDRRRDVVPYVIDLESANGTRVNGDVVEGARYVELMVGDLVRFGESTREYVVMCEDGVV
ncbi:Smad nuclear-interacting protein 1 [Saitoella coloradoensis]